MFYVFVNQLFCHIFCLLLLINIFYTKAKNTIYIRIVRMDRGRSSSLRIFTRRHGIWAASLHLKPEICYYHCVQRDLNLRPFKWLTVAFCNDANTVGLRALWFFVFLFVLSFLSSFFFVLKIPYDSPFFTLIWRCLNCLLLSS